MRALYPVTVGRTERTELMVRQRNETASAIMRTLVRRGPAGRTSLASTTGVSFTTITKAVSELIELGALVESPPAPARGAGRPVVPLDLPVHGRVVVGLHLHPRSTSCGAYTLRGEQVDWRESTARGHTREERVNEAAGLVGSVVETVGPDAVLGIGLATPWAERHHGQPPPLLSDVDHDELRAGLSRRLPHPVRLESNVRALAVAQHWWEDVGDDVLTVLIGRSVGVAQMRGDHLVGDGSAAGGLVSHLIVPGSTYPCRCGQSGCVKVTCTDDALLRRSVAAGVLREGSGQRDLYPRGNTDVPALRTMRQERAAALARVLPLIMSMAAPQRTLVRGWLGTEAEITFCIEATRQRYRELVGRDTDVRYHGNARDDFWAHAAAALALDRYLAAPLQHEQERLSRVGSLGD